MQQLSNISGHQSSKVVALLYVFFTIPFMIIGILIFAFGGLPESADGQPAPQFMSWFFILAPLIYGVVGYIFMRLGCFIYNLISKYVGGIEFTLTSNETP